MRQSREEVKNLSWAGDGPQKMPGARPVHQRFPYPSTKHPKGVHAVRHGTTESSMTRSFFVGGGGFRPRQAGEARSPDGTREISRNQGSELPNATTVPQSDVVADMTCSEEKLIPVPGNAVGRPTPVQGGGGILYGDFSAGENSAWGKFRTCPKNQGENSAPPKSAVHWKQKGSWDCDPQKILGEGNDHCA